MKNVGQFYKVSLEQFKKDAYNNDDIIKNIKYHLYNLPENKDKWYSLEVIPNEIVDAEIEDIWNNIKLPKRSTSKSAGYDFFFPYHKYLLRPACSIKIPTGIKVRIIDEWYLAEHIRSSYGFKYKITMANTIGIVDGDYFNNSSNEGHIFIKLHNDNCERKIVTIEQHNAYCQGIFGECGIVDDDDATGVRNGGLGSTGK